MLTCIACSKQLGGSLRHEANDDDDGVVGTLGTRRATKALTAQIKEMALKASGAYQHCKPCSGAAAQARDAEYAESDAATEPGGCDYPHGRAAGSGDAAWSSAPGAAAALRREIEARLRALSSGDVTPSVSRRREGDVVFEEEGEEEREWVAQVEPGVLITFVSLPRGRNDLRRIRFSRDMFDRWGAQRWWAENCDRVMELYNVLRFRGDAFPLPSPFRSDDDDESSKVESPRDSPDTPPLNNERPPRSLRRLPAAPDGGTPGYYSSSDSLDHHPVRRHVGRRLPDPDRRLTPTPNVSCLSVTRAESASADALARASFSRHSEELLSAFACDTSDNEEIRNWVEEDEPGVYITIRALPGGGRELQRVRFSRERFGELRARLWWEKNRARIHKQYL